MSSEQEKDMRVAAAIVQAGCWILNVKREAFLVPPSLSPSVIIALHSLAMQNAMIILGISHAIRNEFIHFQRHDPIMYRCPFFIGKCEFYISQGRKEAEK